MSTLTQSLNEICGIKSFYNTSFRKIPYYLHKNIPENFTVYEILKDKTIVNSAVDFGQEVNGLFVHCLLQKRLIDTPGAIKLLSRELHIPSDWIGYAGLKDAKGITHQRISIFNTSSDRLENLQFSNFFLSNIKRKKYEVNLGDLWGNRFSIQLDQRDTAEYNDFDLDEIQSILEHFKDAIFPNYFGLQRFGSSRPVSHLLGKYILKNDYESAVKTYLTTISIFENEKISQLRKDLSQSWNYEQFLESIPRNYHYEVVLARSLVNHPNNYYKALNEIPLRMRKFFVNSYQSYIFNELLSKYIMEYNSDEDLIQQFPIISKNVDFSVLPSYLQEHLDYILKKDEISIDNFHKTKFSFDFKKKRFRKTFISMEDFQFKIEKEKILLDFSLPKSSYATMVIREITGGEISN